MQLPVVKVLLASKGCRWTTPETKNPVDACFYGVFGRFWTALENLWRTEGDSNPRYAINVYTLSRRAPSTTRPPVRTAGHKKCHLSGCPLGWLFDPCEVSHYSMTFRFLKRSGRGRTPLGISQQRPGHRAAARSTWRSCRPRYSPWYPPAAT